MKITRSTLHIGLERPVRVLHVTDTHVAITDERDEPHCRAVIYKCQMSDHDIGGKVKIEHLKSAVAYANEHCDILINTGDAGCHVSIASMEATREVMDASKRSLFIAGNHDFSLYGYNSGWEGRIYKLNFYRTVREHLGRDVLFASEVVGGVNFVGIDDSFNQVEDWQTERLRREVAKGYPVVLCMHIPLFEQSLYDLLMARPDKIAYLVGCDEEHLMRMSEYRAYQHRPEPATARFVDYVNSEPRIKALLTGHLHFDYESRLPGGAVQYVTNKNQDDCVRELIIT